MKKYKVSIFFESEYNADSKIKVMKMIAKEYGLGDVENLDIEIEEL